MERGNTESRTVKAIVVAEGRKGAGAAGLKQQNDRGRKEGTPKTATFKA